MQSKGEKAPAWQYRARRVPELHPSAASTPLERARLMRRTPGDAERKFWSRTRNRRLGAFKIRRQVPIGPFIADFLCAEARLVIEIDGDQHADAIAYDTARTRYLERHGYAVIRFSTHEVLHEIGLVLERLHHLLVQRLAELREC